MIKLSAVIICFNEEKKIEKCLESIHDLADEIVVLDSFSTDRTKEICLKYSKVKFFEQKFKGHVEQKNDALNLATFDHVLSLDADEALSEELRKSVGERKQNFQHDGYYFSRLTFYKNFPVKHCGWYPDKKLRLFIKSKGKWSGMNPHDKVVLEPGSSFTQIAGDLLHYSYDSISDHVAQTNYFTTIAAQEAFQRGVRSSTFKIVSRTILKFLKDYFLKLGFLDGRTGFVICYINALSACLKYSKIKELEHEF
jgi:glycosyltransferase involved in cell wall biosynthesis